MYELKLLSGLQSGIVPVKALKEGEIGIVMEENYQGHVLLRTYQQIISLTDPRYSWTPECSLKVRKLMAGEVVRLELK